jgi:hypothetical protein
MAATVVVMAIDELSLAKPSAAARPASGRRGRRSSAGPDRLTVALFTVAGFLVVLALLSQKLPTTGHPSSVPVHVVRKIYRTTIVETIVGASGPSGASVSQSVSSSGSGYTAAAATTRTS